MPDNTVTDIRLTYEQRLWVMAYLIIAKPHVKNDKFSILLTKLLAKPPVGEVNPDHWDRALGQGR